MPRELHLTKDQVCGLYALGAIFLENEIGDLGLKVTPADDGLLIVSGDRRCWRLSAEGRLTERFSDHHRRLLEEADRG